MKGKVQLVWDWAISISISHITVNNWNLCGGRIGCENPEMVFWHMERKNRRTTGCSQESEGSLLKSNCSGFPHNLLPTFIFEILIPVSALGFFTSFPYLEVCNPEIFNSASQLSNGEQLGPIIPASLAGFL